MSRSIQEQLPADRKAATEIAPVGCKPGENRLPPIDDEIPQAAACRATALRPEPCFLTVLLQALSAWNA